MNADASEWNGRLHAQLQLLLDERAIRAVLTRYCRGADRCDAALIASCFHEDAIDDHGNWIMRGDTVGPHVVGLIAPSAAVAMHLAGNMLIEVEGDVAFTETYVLAFRDYEDHGQQFTRTRAVRFVDRFERRASGPHAGEWRIAERVVVDDWNRVDEVVRRQPGGEQFRYGTKDRSDPAFAIRRGRVAGNRS